MTDPNTTNAGLGGPDLTPTKSVTSPSGQDSWIGSGSAGRPVARSAGGNQIANWMLGGGLIALVFGAIFYSANQGYYGNASWAYFGLALGATGGQLAMLGLHAMAVRDR